MPERGIYRAASVKGYAMPTNAPVYVNSSDNLIHIIPIGSGTTEQIIPVATSTSGARFAAGTATLASGTKAVATGLTQILSFSVTSSGAEQLATGDKSVQSFGVTVGTGASGGTGTVTAYYATVASVGSGAMAASTGSSGTFNWIAVGM